MGVVSALSLCIVVLLDAVGFLGKEILTLVIVGDVEQPLLLEWQMLRKVRDVAAYLADEAFARNPLAYVLDLIHMVLMQSHELWEDTRWRGARRAEVSILDR
jgi:hypothetical protein